MHRKTMLPPKTVRPKPSGSNPRASMVGIPSTSRKMNTKDTNATIMDFDTTISKIDEIPEIDTTQHQIEYNKFLQALLQDIFVEEKITREETDMDIQMASLANRFTKTSCQLERTNRRLKEINFVVEQQRLINLKNQDVSNFHKILDESDFKGKLDDLIQETENHLNKLELNNVDFGYDKETGHKQLLDAVNDAIDGLEQIQKHSKCDLNMFKEYERLEKNLDDVEQCREEFANLKKEFESKYPAVNEMILLGVSEKIASLIENDE